MRIETLLYVYLFICSGMIVFNIITAIVLKRRDRRTVRASARFRQHILQQIERINTGQQVERRHKKYLSRQLTRTGNMIAFDKMLEAMRNDGTGRIPTWKNGNDVFDWWMEDDNIEGQLSMFDDVE